MSFLPKSLDGHEFLNFLIAIPLTLLGTGFIYFLIENGSRGVGI